MNLKRVCWIAWLHTVDAAVTRLDRVMATPPSDTTWVPEARPVEAEQWEDTHA